jgi:DNA-directed RNA polymerase subunit omega
VYQPEDSMMHPQVERLLEKVDSKFTLVSLGATRARQINMYYNNLGEGLGSMIPPQVTSVARKPLSIAFEEIVVDKICVGDPPPPADEEALDADAGEDPTLVAVADDDAAAEADSED